MSARSPTAMLSGPIAKPVSCAIQVWASMAFNATLVLWRDVSAAPIISTSVSSAWQVEGSIQLFPWSFVSPARFMDALTAALTTIGASVAILPTLW